MLNDLNGRDVYWTSVALIACGEVCCYSLNVCTEIDWPWCSSVLRRVRMQFECIVAKLDNLTSIPKAQLLLHDKCRTGAAWFTLMLRRNSLAKCLRFKIWNWNIAKTKNMPSSLAEYVGAKKITVQGEFGQTQEMFWAECKKVHSYPSYVTQMLSTARSGNIDA